MDILSSQARSVTYAMTIPGITFRVGKMKTFVIFNVVTAALLAITLISLWVWQNPFSFLFFALLIPAYIIASVASILSTPFLWKNHRARAFIPLATCALCAAMLAGVLPLSSWLIRHGSPRDPNMFLTENTRTVLEEIAKELLGNSIKEIRTFPSQPTKVEMIAGYPQQAVAPEISKELRRRGFYSTRIDDAQSLVVFGHYYFRTWYEYLYTTTELLPLYTRPVSFTEVDVELWSELIDIVKQGPDATAEERDRIVFSPNIAFPYLQKALGDAAIERIGSYKSELEITQEEKDLVLAALNEQRKVSSRLIENPDITFDHDKEGMAPLHFEPRGGASSGFWVVTLINDLINEGTLFYADDKQHLKIKGNLSADETRKIEWVHVGLIEFIYGNLISKRENAYERSLGDGWYFNRK